MLGQKLRKEHNYRAGQLRSPDRQDSGMVCKIAMQRWLERGICPTEKKEQFGKWVIELYDLANEIADAALQQQEASY